MASERACRCGGRRWVGRGLGRGRKAQAGTQRGTPVGRQAGSRAGRRAGRQSVGHKSAQVGTRADAPSLLSNVICARWSRQVTGVPSDAPISTIDANHSSLRASLQSLCRQSLCRSEPPLSAPNGTRAKPSCGREEEQRVEPRAASRTFGWVSDLPWSQYWLGYISEVAGFHSDPHPTACIASPMPALPRLEPLCPLRLASPLSPTRLSLLSLSLSLFSSVPGLLASLVRRVSPPPPPLSLSPLNPLPPFFFSCSSVPVSFPNFSLVGSKKTMACGCDRSHVS